VKRLNIFEFEDQTWFPAWLRQCMTLYLVRVHHLLKTELAVSQLLAALLRLNGATQLVDLCSGAGGPMVEAWASLRKTPAWRRLGLVLTDLYPNTLAARSLTSRRLEGLEYRAEPVDARRVPENLAGVRTLICSLHHLSPQAVVGVLADALASGQPILVVEMAGRRLPLWAWWLTLPFGFLMVLLLTPFVRPLGPGQLFFTYVVPILPLCLAWDGAASNLRCYSEAELRAILAGLEKEGWSWKIGRWRPRGFPMRMLYLVGTPMLPIESRTLADAFPSPWPGVAKQIQPIRGG
jgi:hypothetical protein